MTWNDPMPACSGAGYGTYIDAEMARVYRAEQAANNGVPMRRTEIYMCGYLHYHLRQVDL